jgi:tripartite-type tricarboxylate transporter receptor subunit TctC
MVAPKLEQKWGKSIVVENKPGAGGIIGAVSVQKAAPDGHTLMIAPSAVLAINVTVYKSLPYDPRTDFVPLAFAAQTPFVLIVNPSLPVHSVADLIKYAKEKRGQLAYASAGAGTPHHLFAELLKAMTGIEMTQVPYKGSLPSLNDVVAGHVPLMFVDVGPALGILQAGKVRALGISTKTRFAALPDIPPLAEVGVPGFDAASWQIFVAPAKTPQPVVDKLHDDLKRVLDAPDVKDQILKNGMIPTDASSVPALRDFIKAEIVRWGKVVQQAGLTATQ